MLLQQGWSCGFNGVKHWDTFSRHFGRFWIVLERHTPECTCARAANTKVHNIAVFHQSTFWLRTWARSIRSWIGTCSASDLAALVIISLCGFVMIGAAVQHTLWYRRKYRNTKTIDKV